jgi:hypothetical protein
MAVSQTQGYGSCWSEQSFALCFLACAFTPANALTQEERLARLEAAGYSQIRENGSGKIKTFKAVKNGKEVSVIVDSRGQIRELQ